MFTGLNINISLLDLSYKDINGVGRGEGLKPDRTVSGISKAKRTYGNLKDSKLGYAPIVALKDGLGKHVSLSLMYPFLKTCNVSVTSSIFIPTILAGHGLSWVRSATSEAGM